MLATYSASKSFLCTWTQALGREVESKGVSVQLLNTYFVVRSFSTIYFLAPSKSNSPHFCISFGQVSSMSKIRRASLTVPTPRTYVRAALSKIGVPGGALGKPYTSTPYWVHSIGDAVLTGLNWPSFYMTITLSEPILFLQLFVLWILKCFP